MRGGKVFIILGVVLFLGALAVGGVWFLSSRQGEPSGQVAGEGTPSATQMPSDMIEIVVAVQNIPRGMRITSDSSAVVLQSWPLDSAPEGRITDLEAVYGRITRVEVVRGMPMVEDMLTEEAGALTATGSDAALQIPAGRVAYALPVAHYSSLAWALQPGDHVDVMLSMLMTDLDEELQAPLPLMANCLSPSEEEGCSPGVWGRMEVLPNGWIVNLTPRDGATQWPRLVTQLTVQDAIVLQVGEWPEPGQAAREEAAVEDETAEGEGEGEQQAPRQPSPDRVEPLTLAVTRQDAMVLDFAWAAGARINLVLRRAGDAETTTTDAVTLQYLMERFAIVDPPKLPYGITPPMAQLSNLAEYEFAADYCPPVCGGGGGQGGE